MRRLSNAEVILERQEADVHELLQHLRDLVLLSLELLEVVERHPRCAVLAGLVALTDVEVGAQQHLARARESERERATERERARAKARAREGARTRAR